MSFCGVSIGRLFHSRVQLPWYFCHRSVSGTVHVWTSDDLRCRRPTSVTSWDSRQTDAAGRGRAETCTPAPPVWSRFCASQAANEAVWALEWCGHVDELQWRAALPRSVPTAAVGSDRQRCHTAERYSSLVGITRTTEHLGIVWQEPAIVRSWRSWL